MDVSFLYEIDENISSDFNCTYKWRHAEVYKLLTFEQYNIQFEHYNLNDVQFFL